MRKPRFALMMVLPLALAAATAAHAQWSSDPSVNLALADRPDEQAVPKIAATPDGGAYVGWYDRASGNYDLYLQRLDSLGFEQWGHNGMLVSGHPQDTWVMDWHLIADSEGAAVLVFCDIRDGVNLSLHAYRIGSDGTMLWGPDGITLSPSRLSEMPNGARVVQASDGDFVFIWSMWSVTMGHGGSLQMQRVSPDGTVRFEEGGLAIVKSKGVPAFPDLVAAGDGSVIVAWLSDNLLESKSKYLFARKFGPDGAAIWPHAVNVFDECSLPVAYKPEIQPDGHGGALLAWHYTPWLVYNSSVQHLGADGTELFPHNGVTVSTNPDLYHFYPALSHDPLTGELYVFFREYDSVWGLYGISGQRFSPQGERLWGDGGKALVSLSPVEVSYPLAVPAEGGAMVFWLNQPAGAWGAAQLLGVRVDGSGEMLWGGQPVEVSSCPSAKYDTQLARNASGTAMLVWNDRRDFEITGQDIYGQNVHSDGTLGN